MLELSFFDYFLQENIDTVTVEWVENVGEEDCIKIETEEDYIQLVGTIKTEQEVSFLCWCILWYWFIYRCVHVCFIVHYG
jgi:hypothetical protein